MDELLPWIERLRKMNIGDFIELPEGATPNGVYSAAHKLRHINETRYMRFGIKKSFTDGKKYIIRKEDTKQQIN
jgi:hypothetical protein